MIRKVRHLLVIFSLSIIQDSCAINETQSTFIVHPELIQTAHTYLEFFTTVIYEKNEYLNKNFHKPMNVVEVVLTLQENLENRVEAFKALDLSFQNIVNFFHTYNFTTYESFERLNVTLNRILSSFNDRLQGNSSFLWKEIGVEWFSLSAYYITHEYEKAYELIANGTYNENAYKKFVDILNFRNVTDFTDMIKEYAIDLVSGFAHSFQLDFATIIRIMGIPASNFEKALDNLGVTDAMIKSSKWHISFTKDIGSFLQKNVTFGAILKPTEVITHKDAGALKVYNELKDFMTLSIAPLDNSKTYPVYIDEGSFINNHVILKNNSIFPSTEYWAIATPLLPQSISGTAGVQNFRIPIIENGRVVFRSVEVYEADGKMIIANSNNLRSKMGDGTPLCDTELVYAFNLQAISDEKQINFTMIQPMNHSAVVQTVGAVVANSGAASATSISKTALSNSPTQGATNSATNTANSLGGVSSVRQPYGALNHATDKGTKPALEQKGTAAAIDSGASAVKSAAPTAFVDTAADLTNQGLEGVNSSEVNGLTQNVSKPMDDALGVVNSGNDQVFETFDNPVNDLVGNTASALIIQASENDVANLASNTVAETASNENLQGMLVQVADQSDNISIVPAMLNNGVNSSLNNVKESVSLT